MNASAIFRQRGFSLIELMISTVVALFATVAILQAFATSEGYRRTATSGGDAMFGGAVAGYTIDRDLQMAGYGINATTYLGCTVSGYDELPPGQALVPFTLAPVQIVPGADAKTPDQVIIVSSSSNVLPGAIGLTTTMASSTDDYQVNNAFGITAGDVLLLAESGLGCTIAQATNTPTSTQTLTVHHVSGTYKATSGATVKARYNEPGGLGPIYNATAVMLDLGAAPIVNRYQIQNNTLVVDQLIADQFGQAVAPNIVHMKALYGKDTVGNGTITAWNTTAPVTSTDWSRVLAIRLALVSRSAQPEKQSTTSPGNCTTTTNSQLLVTWDDGSTTTLDVSNTGPANASPGASWQCYRYKVFHMTSSLRNLIWTPS